LNLQHIFGDKFQQHQIFEQLFFLLSDAQVDALPEQMNISREFESCRPSLTQVNVFAEKLKL